MSEKEPPDGMTWSEYESALKERIAELEQFIFDRGRDYGELHNQLAAADKLLADMREIASKKWEGPYARRLTEQAIATYDAALPLKENA